MVIRYRTYVRMTGGGSRLPPHADDPGSVRSSASSTGSSAAVPGGGALVVRLNGETVVDLAGGHADRHRTRPWTHDTLAISFSTTKGVASTVLHRLAERGLLAYDDPVAQHWPAFAEGGKERVTVRDLLTHRAGLHSARAVAERAEDLLDHVAMEEKLAARRPHHAPDDPLGVPRDHLRLARLRPAPRDHRQGDGRPRPGRAQRAAEHRRAPPRRARKAPRARRRARRLRAAAGGLGRRACMAPVWTRARRAQVRGRRVARPRLPPPLRGRRAADLDHRDARGQRHVQRDRPRAAVRGAGDAGRAASSRPRRRTSSAASRSARPTPSSA